MSTTSKQEEFFMDFLHEHNNEGNLPSLNISAKVNILSTACDIESVWYNDDDDEMYLHVDHPMFEADVKVSSLPDEEIDNVINQLM